MLLGKRPRPPMQRTTSMSEFAPVEIDFMIMEAADADESQPSDPHHRQQLPEQPVSIDFLQMGHVAPAGGMLSPRTTGLRRNSGDFRVLETAPFLKACGLCMRRLGPGRDIFMYRGEVAFCSVECRQQLITQEECKEKCALSSIKAKTQAATATTSESPSNICGLSV